MKNYLETVNMIEDVCMQHPFVNSFFYEKYTIGGDDNNVCYPAIFLTPNSATLTNTLDTYSFNIVYIDRLTEREDNKLNVQSTGIDTIKSIANMLLHATDLIVSDGSTIVNVYTGQLADNVAGAVSEISFSIPSNQGACLIYDYCPKC